MKPRTAILASGEGTTAETFIRACVAAQVDAEVVVVICNREKAGIFKRIENLNAELGLNIKTLLINSHTHPAREDERVVKGGQTAAEEKAILHALRDSNIDIVLLMGYLRRIGPRLIENYGWLPSYSSPYQASMLNTHCGPLPETKGLWGLHVQEHVLASGLPCSGQTLHVVAQDYDDGPVLNAYRVPVEPGDTPETLFARVQTIEKQHLPVDIATFITARQHYLKEKE